MTTRTLGRFAGLALALGALTAAGAACAEPVDGTYRTPATAERSTTSTTRRPATTTTEAPYLPVPADFTLAPVITRKQCFGSAGCNVSYTIDVTYNALKPLDPGATYAITYEVHGGESVAIDTIELDGDGTYMDREVMAGTPTEAATLSVVVTSVRER